MIEKTITPTGNEEEMIKNHESLLEDQVLYLGRLDDFKLGNENGIPSKLAKASNEELEEYGKLLLERLTTITDIFHLACIDGRCKKCNADGSQPEIRANQVGATGILLPVAMNAEADFLGNPEDRSLGENTKLSEDFYGDTTGIRPSAHLGGCGGVNGEVEDEDAIASNPKIIGATNALMSQPNVLSFTNLPFDAELGQRVSINAERTKHYLISQGWSGQEYVDAVTNTNPAGVEDLETTDDPHHGHAEDAIAIVIGQDRAIDMQDVFTVSLDASKKMALAFAGQRGAEGAQQALIANLAKHLATSSRLASPQTPIFLVIAN